MRGLVVLALGALLAACGGPAPTPSLGSPGPGAPGSIASAVPTLLPSLASTTSDGWTNLLWAAPTLTAPYETISDVVAWDDGYVAVGGFQNAKGGAQAAAWFSTDWRTWTRTLLDVPPSGDSSLWRVLSVGSHLVAIGTSGILHCVPPQGEGQVCDPLPISVWTSTDGHSWQHAPTPTSLAGVTIADVAAGPSGLILVGDTGWDKPGIWTSADGVAWHRETLPSAVFARAHLSGIATVADGWVLTGATGGAKPVCCAGGGSDTMPAAWFSTDGVNWQAASIEGAGAAIGDQIRRVFVAQGGLAAWGGRNGSTGWVSRDGRRWSPLPTPTGYPVTPRASDGHHIIGDSYVAGGHVAYWLSTDGASWQPLSAIGSADDMPHWDASGGATADAAFLFPTGLGLTGQNGTDRFPIWFAQGGPNRN